MKKTYNKENSVIKQITETLSRTFGKSIASATQTQLYKAFAITVKNEIMEKWVASESHTDNKQ